MLKEENALLERIKNSEKESNNRINCNYKPFKYWDELNEAIFNLKRVARKCWGGGFDYPYWLDKEVIRTWKKLFHCEVVNNEELKIIEKDKMKKLRQSLKDIKL